MDFICQAVLCDLDGVLVDSTSVVRRCWVDWAEEQGLDAQEVLTRASGRRIVEVIQEIAPHLDAKAEARRLAAREAADTEGLEIIPGSSSFLEKLSMQSKWAVVTSGQRLVARRRLSYAELPTPSVFVAAEDVSNGKPHPDPYLEAAKQLGVAQKKCLVLEDSAAGIRAAQAADMQVIGVATSQTPSHATGLVDTKISDLRALEIRVQEGAIQLSLRE